MRDLPIGLAQGSSGSDKQLLNSAFGQFQNLSNFFVAFALLGREEKGHFLLLWQLAYLFFYELQFLTGLQNGAGVGLIIYQLWWIGAGDFHMSLLFSGQINAEIGCDPE
jgi:hypothetical protein